MLRKLPFHRSTLNVIFLGICFAFIFTAYLTLSNLEKIFLYSLQHDDPSFTGDGYVSQGFVYAAFSLSLWFAPSVDSVLGSKLTMVIGVVGYELFICSFLFHITWLIYLASLIVGVGAALVWTGQSSYVILNSNQENLERNLGLFQIIFWSGSLLGNIYTYIAFLGKKYIDEDTRRLVIIFLCILVNMGAALLLFLPKSDKEKKDAHTDVKSQPENSAESDTFALKQNTQGAWKTFQKSWSVMWTGEFLILGFMFCNLGLSTAFTVIFNSCMGFTNNIPNAKEWVPVAGFMTAVGVVLGGILPLVLNTEAKLPLRMRPLMVIGFFGYMISYVIAFLNFPNESIFGDTDNVALMTANPYLCLFGAMVLHTGEILYYTESQTLLARIFPNDTVPAFAIFLFVKNIFVSLAFNLSNIYGLHVQLMCLTVMCVLGLFSFAYVSLQVTKRHSETADNDGLEGGGRENAGSVVES